jgi:hypothetical protein
MYFYPQVLNPDTKKESQLKKALLHLLRAKDHFYVEQFEHFYNDAMKKVHSRINPVNMKYFCSN